MFSKKNESAAKTTNFDVIIGSNSSLEGKLTSSGSIRIDGKMDGDIATEGDVIIGQEARTDGNIKSSNIEISGSVEGDIVSDGCLKIFSTGSLFGNIKVKSFVIEEDGVFEGMCHINAQGIKKSTANKSNHMKPKTDEKSVSSVKSQVNPAIKQNKIG